MASPGSGRLTLDSALLDKAGLHPATTVTLRKSLCLSFLELGKVSVVSEGLPHEKRAVLGDREWKSKVEKTL